MSKIEQQVMASVGVIYAVRQLFSATALKLYVCVASLWGIGQLVWVSRVFENLSSAGLQGAVNFVLAAVLNTDLLVQLTLVVGVVAFISLAVDMTRLSQPKTHWA